MTPQNQEISKRGAGEWEGERGGEMEKWATACGHLLANLQSPARPALLEICIWNCVFVREKMLKLCLSKNWPGPGVCRCEQRHWNASNELQRYKSLAATVQNFNRAINKNTKTMQRMLWQLQKISNFPKIRKQQTIKIGYNNNNRQKSLRDRAVNFNFQLSKSHLKASRSAPVRLGDTLNPVHLRYSRQPRLH